MRPGSSILIVDRETLIRIALRIALEREGYVVETAASGEAAVELLERRAFDVLITELDLHDLGGLELAHLARQRHPRMATVLMSETDRPAVDRLSDFGVQRVIDKPFRIPTIVREIREVRPES